MDSIITILNQTFEIAKKAKKNGHTEYDRSIRRILESCSEEGYVLNSPDGEVYDERRTDYSANLVGDEAKKMIITEVLKPIIYQAQDGKNTLVQRGVVIAEKK
jgi:hypothetical protein